MQQTVNARQLFVTAAMTIALITVLGTPRGPAAAQAPAPELGVWYNHSGKGAVEIYRCQQDQTRLCGRIVWLKTQTYDNGEPLRDRRNSNASLRNRTICGIPVLGNLAEKAGGGWNNGWVYDPEKGSTFGAAIHANASGSALKLTGSKGIFWKTFMWKRAPNDLPRCSPLE
jgi:uncharacterized protein (DUF2147 family)